MRCNAIAVLASICLLLMLGPACHDTEHARIRRDVTSKMEDKHGAGQGLVPSRDANGKPLFYYGRVRLKDHRTLSLLDFLGFTHADVPFFDDFDRKLIGKDPPDPGWRYAIATGFQWNILLQFPSITAGVEFNPKHASGAYPFLDMMTGGAANGPLSSQELANIGFKPKRPQVIPLSSCRDTPPRTMAQNMHAVWFGEDVLTAVGDAAGAVGQIIADFSKGAVKDFTTIVSLAYQGVQEAIDFLRKLGNDGVCAITGSTDETARVLVINTGTANLQTDQFVRNPDRSKWPSSSLDAEPIRNATAFARGGPGGVLLEEGGIDVYGNFTLTTCNGFSYTTYVRLNSPAVQVVDTKHYGIETTTIATPIEFDLDSSTRSADPAGTYYPTDKNAAAWFIGAQIGARQASAQYKFYPDKVTISLGAAAKAMIALKEAGGKNPQAVTACGEMAAVAPLLSVSGLGPILTAGDISADIFGFDTSSKAFPAGVAIHEYGHYMTCEVLRQLRSTAVRNEYLWSFLKLVLESVFHASPDDWQLNDDLRNTGESIADVFAFRAYGYTDYFATNGPGKTDPKVCLPGPVNCLDVDINFLLVPDGPPRNRLASRASVMYDWMAVPPTPPGDIHIGVTGREFLDAIAYAGAASGEAIAAALGDTPLAAPYCVDYLNHAWPCPDYTLQGATDFSGVALSTQTVRWSWLPNAVLAQAYALQTYESGTWSDFAVLPASSFTKDSEPYLPNQRVVARVQSRRSGAGAGNSVVAAVCTLAAQVPAPSVLLDGGGLPSFSWTHNGSTGYRVVRVGPTGEVVVTKVDPGTGTTLGFADSTAPPVDSLQYRVDSENCDGVVTKGALSVPIAVPPSDSHHVFVRQGGTGDGTKANPFGAISDALAIVSPMRRTILVAATTGGFSFNEWLTVPALPGGVALYAGFKSDFTGRIGVTLLGPGAGTRVVSTGSGEFERKREPLVYALGDLLLDRFVVGTTASNATFVFAPPSSTVSVSLSVLNAKPVVDPMDSQGLIEAGVIALDRFHAVGTSLLPVAAAATSLTVHASTIIGRVTGVRTVLSAPSVLVTESTVRTSDSSWSAPQTATAISGHSVAINSSIVAGGQPIFSDGVAGVRQSVLRGTTDVAHGRLVNNIFFPPDGGTQRVALRLWDNDSCSASGIVCDAVLAADEVRGNYFVVGPSSPAVMTRWRTINALGVLNGQNVMLSDQGASWFGAPTAVGSNLSGSNLQDLFILASGAPDVAATPLTTMRFHPTPKQPGTTKGALILAGVIPSPLGQQTDIVGSLFTLPPNIGPYAASYPDVP